MKVRVLRILALLSVLLLLTLLYQAPQAAATLPSAGSSLNHALATSGGTATASSSRGGYDPGRAIDGSTTTLWRSTSAPAWLAVQFADFRWIDEVHVHFGALAFPDMELYADVDGDGSYGLLVAGLTGNADPNVVLAFAEVYARGVKLVQSNAVVHTHTSTTTTCTEWHWHAPKIKPSGGVTTAEADGDGYWHCHNWETVEEEYQETHYPEVAELEAFKGGDADGDGLTNAEEATTLYYWNHTAASMEIPDVAPNTSALSLVDWDGVLTTALADLTIDHENFQDLLVALEHWNGSSWRRSYLWDPGYTLLKASITPQDGAYVEGTVNVTAAMHDPSVLQWVSIRLDGTEVANLSAPTEGHLYNWTWDTAGVEDGEYRFTVTAFDLWGDTASQLADVWVDQSPPSVTITSPAQGATVSGTIAVQADATDSVAVDRVEFLLDGQLRATDTAAPFAWSWNTEAGSNGGHTLTARAWDMAGHYAADTVDVTVSNGDGGGSCGGCKIQSSGTLSPSSTEVVGGVEGSAPTADYSVTGTTHHLVVDLLKPQEERSPEEVDNRILTANLPPVVLHEVRTWRLWVEDLEPGSEGMVTAFGLYLEMRTDEAVADGDSDGLSDGEEARLRGTSPVAADTDQDGLNDAFELQPYGMTLVVDGTPRSEEVTTSPFVADTDTNGLLDGQEYDGAFGAPTHPNASDTDGDGLPDGDEVFVHSSNATATDTDADSLSDDVEVNPRSLTLEVNGTTETRSVTTLAYATDSDGDGLRDDEEWYGTSVYGNATDPSDPDTDGDGLPDGQERYVLTYRTKLREPISDAGIGGGYPYEGFGRQVLQVGPISAPLASIAGAEVMWGLTHPNVGEIGLTLSAAGNEATVREYNLNIGMGSNFSSTDLLSLGPFGLSDLAAGLEWSLRAGDSTEGNRGQLEYLEFQVTVRTDPLRFDTDADGLNDTEEVSMGADGFLTDPWDTDTDGDGLSDDEFFVTGTDPRRPDTDLDGYDDASDNYPLADAFVQVHVVDTYYEGSDDDGSPGLEPFVAVTYEGERSFSKHVGTGQFGHFYSFDVPDNATSVSLGIEAWDWDADDSHDSLSLEGGSNATTLTYALGPHIGWFEWFTLTGSTNPRVVNLTVKVDTVAPTREPLFLVVPQDYASIYNVTSDGGAVLSRRYVGEPRFYALLVNLTDPACGFDGDIHTWLVPHALLFDTYLHTRLNDAANVTGWLADPANNVSFAQNGSAGPGTSALSGVLTADLDNAEYETLQDWLLQNASGGVAHTYLRIDHESSVGDYLPLLGLPEAILRLAPYGPLPNSPSQAYVFDYRPLWQRLWEGALEVLTASLEYIHSGLVATWNFMVQLPTLLAQFGAWVWASLVQAKEAVAAAMVAAEEILTAFVSWVVDAAVNALKSVLAPLLDALVSPFTSALGSIVEGIHRVVEDPSADLAVESIAIAASLFLLATALGAIPIAVRAAEIAIKALTLGVGALVTKLISKTVAEFVVRTLAYTAVSLAAMTVFTTTLFAVNWIGEATLDLVASAGLAVITTAAASKILFETLDNLFSKTVKDESLFSRWRAVGFALTSLALIVVGTSLAGAVLMAVDVVAALLSVFALAFYVRESKKPVNQGLDVLSDLGHAMERIAVFAAPAVAAVMIGGRVAAGNYNG